MTLQQFDNNINALLNDVPIIVTDILMIVAMDSKALIQQRVQETGKNASGGSTPQYSESYKKYRQKKGRQVNYMDATLTGDMWQSTGITDRNTSGNEVKVTLAGRDDFAQKKIDNISTKHFELLKLSKEEDEILEDVFRYEAEKVILTYLNRGF